MRRGELQDEMARLIASTRPSHFLHRHTLSLAVAGVIGRTETHRGCIVTSHVADVTIMNGIGGILHPSIGALAILHHHRSHTLGRDVALGILMALLQIEHGNGIVATRHSGCTAESGLLDAIIHIRHESLIVESHSLRTRRKRDTPVDGLRSILGAGDRFAHIAQKEGAGSQHLDVDESEHLHLFYMGNQFGTISPLVLVAIHRVVGFIDARYVCQHIG